MKASNTHIMVQATRLLISKMNDEDMDYPVHLGVTEAGEGEDGRIRSAVGIGALLADGIGDTIRVSLTEDPELEIPVAKKMIDYLKLRLHHKPVPSFGDYPIDPFHYTRRITDPVGILGGKNVSGVFHSLHGPVNYENLSRIGWRFSEKKGWHFTDLAPDFLIVDQWPLEMPPPKNRGILTQQDHEHPAAAKIQKIMTFDQFISQKEPVSEIHFVSVSASRIDHETIQHLRQNDQTVLILETDHPNGYADQRAALFRLINDGCRLPVVLKRRYYEYEGEDLQLKASMDLGGLFIDGLGDGIWIENTGEVPDEIIVSAAFGILQAGRVRISKTEFISCPSCGRTLFDLQSTTRKIRERTQHLKGLKIGIMGCIVNGPGEMADADYGYVGAAKGHVTLYKEKNVVRKNVPEHEAVDALISLIKENNDWTEPESP
jgi:(E)-4-hydroxy-3-methylbut-2-enyl-diphosphate synthase